MTKFIVVHTSDTEELLINLEQVISIFQLKSGLTRIKMCDGISYTIIEKYQYLKKNLINNI